MRRFTLRLLMALVGVCLLVLYAGAAYLTYWGQPSSGRPARVWRRRSSTSSSSPSSSATSATSSGPSECSPA
ncbi:hypothetical protein [Halospeciosus flavus]|uniref:hypothetical protein n=1 Tax=Halospeciosus flavus TaxID=3032283 RepID=UPI0036162C12